jgi:PAS domain S-box-containing protein
MASGEAAQKYAGLFKLLGTAVSYMRLYGENHPSCQQSVSSLELEFEKIFAGEPELVLGLAGDRLIIGGVSYEAREVRGAEFSEICQRFGADHLVFKKGLDSEEIRSFLKLLGARAKDLETKGGFRKLFESAGFAHVVIPSGRFEIVKEGEKVVGAGAPEGGQGGTAEAPPAVVQAQAPALPTSVKELIEVFRQESSGPVTYDYGRLGGEIEKEPGFVAKLMIKSAQTPEEFSRILGRMGDFFKEEVTPRFIEAKKDLSKITTRVASEYRKTLNQPEVPEAFRLVGETFPHLLEECADKVRVEIMAKICEETKGDPKLLETWGTKLLKEESVRARLSEVLKDKLITFGLSQEACQQVFEQAGKAPVRGRKKRGAVAATQGLSEGEVAVPSGELEELRTKAKKLDDLETKYGVLEKDRKRVMDEKERVDAVIRNLAEGLVVVDNSGRVLLMNPAAEKLLGMKSAESVGRPLEDQVKEEHLLAMAQGPLRDPEGSVTKEIELRTMNDETRRVLQASTAVIENEDGKTVGMVSILSDVTKQKELDAMKSKFVSHVSHELRTPLVAIQRSLALLLEQEAGTISHEQRQYVDIAHRNIERLGRLINDILDISKIEAGKLTIAPKPVAPAALIRQLKLTFETWARDKKINLTEKISDESIEIEADTDRLTQVLTNLMGNALKFTPEGGTIAVEFAPAKDASTGADGVEIAVRDTGIGIPEKDRSRIFERFERVSLHQPPGVSSTGLGLTIAKEIVELHGGRIWVESDEGKGSRFAFFLPRKFSPRAAPRGI